MKNRRVRMTLAAAAVTVATAGGAFAAPGGHGISVGPLDPRAEVQEFRPDAYRPCDGSLCAPIYISAVAKPPGGEKYPHAVAIAYCPMGTRPIGGGATVSGFVATARMYANAPWDDDGAMIGWYGGAVGDLNTKGDWTIKAWAICSGVE